jgi:hypothetical protein
MYWSKTQSNPADETRLPYTVDDRVRQVRIVMDYSWLLYLVLTLQSAMTPIFWLIKVTLYITPIAKGFNMTAILAGIDKES